MFKAPFSFSGRITRTEYFVSVLLFLVAGGFSAILIPLSAIILIPATWFILAQGWKRAQDGGWHGLISLIPYVNFCLLFLSGDKGSNSHGPNPRFSPADETAVKPRAPQYNPPPLPDSWGQARSFSAVEQTSSFKCTSCGAQNTNVVHSSTACCQYCGAPKG